VTKLKKILLDRSLLEKVKVIVPPVRIRNREDTLESLKKERLTAGVIKGREEFEDIDLVFQT